MDEKMLAGDVKCDADHDHSHRACLVELVYDDLDEFAREGIVRVYDSIRDTLPSRTRQVAA